jgi:ArsR family transcriptional regulator
MRIVNIVRFYELSVNEILTVLQMGQSRISRHLKILADCNVLQCRRDGLWAFYSLVEEGVGKQLVQALSFMMDNDPVCQDDIARAKELFKNRAKQTSQFFDSIAGNWDLLKNELLGDYNLNALIHNKVKNAHSLVDIGCGTGDLLELLSVYSMSLIGVDNAPKMLAKARQKSNIRGYHVDFRIGSLVHLPMRDNETEYAVVNMVLHHISTPFEALQETTRVVQRGGKIIITELDKHTNENMRIKYGDYWLGFSRQELQQWVTACTLDIEECEHLQVKHNMGIHFIVACKM